MLLRVVALVLPLLASASPPLPKHASGLSSDPSTANGQTFDYLVVGAGLTGMTIASRLSEDPSTTVLLIEAGNDDRLDPRIVDLEPYYGSFFNGPLDWAWPTDQGQFLQGGKTLGGSTSFTATHWIRGMKDGYDAMASLVDGEDWSFNALFPYMKKAEKFYPPTDEQRAKGADYVPEYHGFSGPVHVTFTPGFYGGPQEGTFINVLQNMTGIALCRDMLGGNSNCASYQPHTFNPETNYSRVSSATAYFSPVENQRKNWVTLIGHQVTKILLQGSVPNIVAKGVQFKNSNNTGDTFAAYAHKEVILAAGAVNTPQLLQLSGIGDSAVLKPLGIDVKVDLPGVGKNLQERTRNEVKHAYQATFNPDGYGPTSSIAYLSSRELFAEGAGTNGSITAEQMAAHIKAMYPTWAQSQATSDWHAEALTSIYKVLTDLIVEKKIPVAEFFFNVRDPVLKGLDMWQMNPFSRGNVTITNADAFTKPNVIVNYFSVDYDLAIQTAALRLARRILNSHAYDSILTAEVLPNSTVVPNSEHGGSDVDWHTYIMNNFSPVGHYFGTNAMMRRELGGVVDGKCRVYDTKNLRVVDGSIISLPISAAPQSTLYGMAEKAADIIKKGE